LNIRSALAVERILPTLFWCRLLYVGTSFTVTCESYGLIVATGLWRVTANELLNAEFLMTNMSQSHRSGRDSSSESTNRRHPRDIRHREE